MTNYRKRKNQKAYTQYRETLDDVACQFCEINTESPQLVKFTDHFVIITNIFPYNTWDGRRVTEHLLLVPKVHTETLSTLEPQAKLEFVELMSAYEADGYDVYARSPYSAGKTVLHQHTHLIKPHGKRVRGAVSLNKPYTSIVW